MSSWRKAPGDCLGQVRGDVLSTGALSQAGQETLRVSGLVPYRSAHLDGAESEKVITSWHSVQETPQAILQIRRILHAQLASDQRRP